MSENPVVVIGAGIVGVCVALCLQRDGREVLLLDRADPGSGCSAGNAGVLTTGGAIPEAMPGIIRRVPKMLFDPESPLSVRWRYLPAAMPWLLRFLLASRRPRAEAGAAALSSLAGRGVDAYRALLHGSRAAALLRNEGWLHIYESQASFAAGRYGLELRRRHGSRFTILDPDEAREVEPALGRTIARGVLFPDYSHIVNPREFVSLLADDFASAGGAIAKDEAVGYERRDNRILGVVGRTGKYPAAAVVVAAGAWSGSLAAKLGDRLPLDTERGYHVGIRRPEVSIARPVLSSEGGFIATPMDGELRLAGTVELAGIAAPPNPKRALAMLGRARRLFPGLQDEQTTQWMGLRPSFPDALPVIARASEIENAYLAFGHSHRGLSFAAITGTLIAQLMAGKPPEIDISPFRASRFRML